MLKTIIAAFKERKNFDPCGDLTPRICWVCKEPIDSEEYRINNLNYYEHTKNCKYKTWATALDREEIEREPGAER